MIKQCPKILHNFYKLIKIFYIKVIRINDTAHNIAKAISIGIFLGCIIPVGFQVFAIIFLTFIIRINFFLAFAGSLITNFYTVIFIYPLFYYTGLKILKYITTQYIIEKDINITNIFFSLNNLKNISFNIFIPWAIGAIIYGIILGILSYVITYMIIKQNNKRNK